MLRDRVVVVGVSGGIAAYKACELVRRLRDRGATVLVVMTQAACEFVTPLTFQALSGNPVVTNLWGDQRPRFDLPLESVGKVRGHVEHVDVAEVASALVIAPATADLMARLVHGVAPDALTALVLATSAPILVAPAMDLQMWQNAATQDNARVLRSRGFRFVGPDSGELASGLSGPGRLAEVNAIVDELEAMLRVRTSMKGVRVLPVTTAIQMERALREVAPKSDVLIMAAAVADYRPARASTHKLKRDADPLTVTFEPNPDILAGLGAAKPKGQLVVGFALETEHGVENARKKLAEKHADMIVLNSPDHGIGGDTNQVTLVEARSALELPESSKREVAERILDRIAELRGDTHEAPALKLAGKLAAGATRPASSSKKDKR